MPEGIAVNGDVITWARERAGLSPQEAAHKFPKIAAWETGTALPSYPQLKSMADEFRIPIAVFFFPERPNVPRIEETFRTLPDTEFARLPRRIQFFWEKRRRFNLGCTNSPKGAIRPKQLITQDVEFTARMSADTMAARVRDYLGVSLEQQMAWRNADEALKEWRQALYGVGILFQRCVPRGELFGLQPLR